MHRVKINQFAIPRGEIVLAAKPGFQLDRLSAILLGVLALAGVLLAFVMVYITDRSAKQIEEVKETKVVGHLSPLSAVPSDKEMDGDVPSDLVKAYHNKAKILFCEVDLKEPSFAQLSKLDKATELCLLYTTFDNKWVHYLTGMKSLQILNLEGSTIDGQGMKVIAQMPQVTHLALTSTKIKDADLAYVPPNVEALAIEKMPLGDAALENLPKLDHLRKINMIYTNVSDRGVRHLTRFKSLQRLHFGHTGVADGSLAEIAKLPLMHLDLSYTKVTDAGMSALARVEPAPTTLTIDLSHTAITDKGLIALAPLKRLSLLICAACPGVTEGGIAQLQKALPNCVIKTQEQGLGKP